MRRNPGLTQGVVTIITESALLRLLQLSSSTLPVGGYSFDTAQVMRGFNADSQMFILKTPAPSYDGKHVIVGRVVRGMDVVDRLAAGRVDAEVSHQDLGRPAFQFGQLLFGGQHRISIVRRRARLGAAVTPRGDFSRLVAVQPSAHSQRMFAR